MPVCKLCKLKVNKLCYSHIIPEWCWEPVYDSKHRTVGVTPDNQDKLKILQKGLREYLLCKDCEVKFSRWEAVLKKDLFDIINKKSLHLKIIQLDDNILYIKNINYNSFKNAILSILWRMSISRNSAFQAYKLGKYEELLREKLNKDNTLSETFFPIMIRKIEHCNQHCLFHMTYGNLMRINGNILQCFIICGFEISIGISKHNYSEVTLLLLKQNGDLIIPIIQFSKSLLNQEIINRFKDKDIKQFYGSNFKDTKYN